MPINHALTFLKRLARRKACPTCIPMPPMSCQSMHKMVNLLMRFSCVLQVLSKLLLTLVKYNIIYFQLQVANISNSIKVK